MSTRPTDMGARETATHFIALKNAKGEPAGIFECAPDERLLYAGLRAGMPLPHECATGTCGTCKAKIVSGDVALAWPGAPGLKYLKPGSTEVLLCQSYARSDCSFTVRSAPKMDVDAPNMPAYFDAKVSRSGMLTHDVLIVEAELDRPMHFAAGQFALVEAEGVEGFRAYSMVNPAGRNTKLELIVKRKPDGALTGHLFSRDIGGMKLRVLGPFGRATFDANCGAGDLICAAGGTGIAGLMSVLSEASVSGHLERNRACVFFGVRTASDLFFLDRFDALRRRHPDSVRVVIATSEADVSDSVRQAYPALRFERGMVHEALAAREFSECVKPMAYLAGPAAAVDALTGVLVTRHRLAPTQLRFDRFG